MKRVFYLLFFLSACVIIPGCAKEKDDEPKTDSASVQQLSQDDNNIEAASTEALNDANILMSLYGLKSTTAWPCNATIDSTEVVDDTITYYITYNGANCIGNLARYGKMEVRKRVGTHWIQAGATVLVRFINLKFTRVSTNVSITLNGMKVFKNVSGGYIFQLGGTASSVVYRTMGYLRITFEDNTTRVWHIARQQVFTGKPDSLVLAVDGFGSSGSYTNLVTWGTDRNDIPFFISINQIVVFKEVCQSKPCSGIKQITIPSENKGATVTFGYDGNNQPVTPDDCPVKYKVDWYKDDLSGTIWLWL